MERRLVIMYQDFYNDVMYKERENFLIGHRDKTNRANGYNDRQLKYMIDVTLDLKVPTMRKHNHDLEYSVLTKYKRTGKLFDKRVKSFYKTRMFEREMCEILKISTLPREVKESIKQEYLEKYNDFISSKKQGYDLLKLDATCFGKKDTQHRYTAYFVWGFNGRGKHCLYYNVVQGEETQAGWQELIQYILSNINLEDVKLLISDMFGALKTLLHKNLSFIPLQNCMWHRFYSLLKYYKGGKYGRRSILSKKYSKLLKLETREELEDLLNSFKKLDFYKRRGGSGKLNDPKLDRMISHSWEDNFTFLDLEKEMKNYTRNNLIQTTDIESIFSDMKFYLKKNHKYNTVEELTFKIFFFLEYKNYLPT